MDNPYGSKDSIATLLSLISVTPPKPTNYGSALAAWTAGASLDTTNALLPASPLSLGALSALYAPPSPPKLPVVPLSTITNALTAPAVQRMVYFAFDFDDLIRVNNVRQIGKIAPRERKNARTFQDRSIWESRNIRNEENLKTLMRQGVCHSSAVCILAGTNTWRSRWVKYEIARAVVDERGLLAVHINSINHHIRKRTDLPGLNPLHFMGVWHSPNGNYYLVEKHVVVVDAAKAEVGFEWRRYEDFLDPVPLPRYLPDPAVGYVMPLSIGACEYDMGRDYGFSNIDTWIDAAAQQVNR